MVCEFHVKSFRDRLVIEKASQNPVGVGCFFLVFWGLAGCSVSVNVLRVSVYVCVWLPNVQDY